MPSFLREEGNTSMATVLFDTVTAPNGAPCNVLTKANIRIVPAPTYPRKKMLKKAKQIMSTFFLEKLSTTYPLKGLVSNAAMVYPDNTTPIISLPAPNLSERYRGNKGVKM